MVETRGGRRFAVIFLVAAFLVLLLGRWLQPVDNVALSVAAPFTAAVSSAANWSGDVVSGVFDGPRLRQEVTTLKHQNAVLLRRTIADAELRHQNALYMRMLRYQESNTHLDLLVSRVIGNDSNGTIVPDMWINRGSRDGLRVGMTVLDANGYFVGTLTRVASNISLVQLMLSPSLSVGAYDLRSRAMGLVEGQYAGRPQLDLVPSSASLRSGDIVLTSGQCMLFPRGLTIGQIVDVQHRNVAVYQKAGVQPATDFRDLEMTMVVRNFRPPAPGKLPCSP